MADVFDHLLAVAPEFELEVFQNPTDADFLSYYSTIPKDLSNLNLIDRKSFDKGPIEFT